MAPKSQKFAILYIHFFDKGGLWVGEDYTLNTPHGAARMEEVDTQVHVLSLLTLADILGDMKTTDFLIPLTLTLDSQRYTRILILKRQRIKFPE